MEETPESENNRNFDGSIDSSKREIGGDQGAVFVRLLMEHEPQVRAFLRGLLPTWNDVDEVIQEASLIAWRKFDDFEQGTAFGGWLLTIARFEALKHRRRLARTPLVFDDDILELISAESQSDGAVPVRQEHLEYCLNKLPRQQRELLLKVHTPGVVTREIAKKSGKSEQAFYKTVQRLRAGLLACISRRIELENSNG